MQRQITFRQYRMMDLIFFTAALCICETLITLGATVWFPAEPYTLSLVPAVTAVVLVRWGAWAMIPAALGSLAFCLASHAAAMQFVIYLIGSMAFMVLLPWIRRIGWEKLHDHVLLTMLYGMLAALLMQAGRFLVAFAAGTPAATAAGFFTTDALSTLFAVLIVWIARRLDGMLEDQRHYVRRVKEEQERERKARQEGWEE